MIHKYWKIPYEMPPAPPELLNEGFTPLLSAILSLRGIKTAAEARRMVDGVSCLFDPMLIKGMEAAVQRIHRAMEDKEITAVYGDYDVDGITATCLLTDYLRSKGLRCIPYIPDRSTEGYGLNNAALESLRSQGTSLLITVDCGITAREETRFANELGMDVIITDHHECGCGELPDAVAVIDCKQDGDTYPNKNLAGVGVALKLVCACEGDSEAILERYSDLVAVGTVADVMPLVEENRCLVQRGLNKIRTSARPGLAAMLRESACDIRKLSASTIGYSLAPRLNAAGRLGQASMAAKLLMTEDMPSATTLAVELCELNRKRQSIETGIWQDANAMLAGSPPDAPIVLASDAWHQGVIGIAASRLAEQYSLPAIMVCLNGEVGKGSCRSFGGFNLFEALSACSEHLIGFGGHALAAGLNIRSDKIDDFRQALAAYYRKNRPEEVPDVLCDIQINDPELLSENNVRSLDLLEPYGNANLKPVMCACGLRLESASLVGGGRHLRMKVNMRGKTFEAIFFSHTAEELGLSEGALIDLAFSPQINEFRGQSSVQLVVSAARPHDSEELCRHILSGEAGILWCAPQYCPERADFIRVWRAAQQPGFTVGEDTRAVLAQCPPGMQPECFCLCLMVLMETGLLAHGSKGIYGAVPAEISGKADLDSTHIIRTLKAM